MRSVNQPRLRSRRMNSAALLVAASCTLVLGDVGADAQDALGRGDVLDANPGVGTGGRNLAIPTPDYRARNLLITGDVAGGRGFRDSVGYFADRDFRGELGSDDLFRFRAGAALSSPRFAGLGRVADQFRFGQDLAVLEYRRSPDTGLRQFRPDGLPGADRRISSIPGDDRVMADRVSARYFTVDQAEVDRLRDLQDRSRYGRPVGMAITEEGDRMIVSASPLQGISFQEERIEMALQGISPFDLARLREDAMHGRIDQPIGMARELSFREQLRIDEPTLAEREEVRREGQRLDEHDSPHIEILQRIAQRYAGVDDVRLSIDPSLLEQLDDEFAELRESLQTMRRPREVEAEELMPWSEDEDARLAEEEMDQTPRVPRPERREGETGIDPIDPLLPGEPSERRDRIAEDEEDDPRHRRPSTSMDEIIEMLRHGHTIDRLAPADGSRLNELIITGQSSLRRGDYFTAESRFARALRLEPNHPMAKIGIAHSQLGAGLNQAAAITLRRALSDHPELIDTRYDARLLPRDPRMGEIIKELDDQLDDERVGSSFGLLLAYIGHQLRDRTLVERGLNAMDDADPEDPLLPVLRGVWLAEDDQQPDK